jgi:hypothetical protein
MAPAAAFRALLNTFKPMALRTSFAALKSSSLMCTSPRISNTSGLDVAALVSIEIKVCKW